VPLLLQRTGVGPRGKKSKSRIGCNCSDLMDHCVEFRLYRVDRITSDATCLDLSQAEEAFPKLIRQMENPQGPIDVLIGMDHMCEAPREYCMNAKADWFCTNLPLVLEL
jgi:hypothetical protein